MHIANANVLLGKFPEKVLRIILRSVISHQQCPIRNRLSLNAFDLVAKIFLPIVSRHQDNDLFRCKHNIPAVPLEKKCELEVLMLLNLYCLTRLQQSMRHQQIPFAFSETTRVCFHWQYSGLTESCCASSII